MSPVLRMVFTVDEVHRMSLNYSVQPPLPLWKGKGEQQNIWLKKGFRMTMMGRPWGSPSEFNCISRMLQASREKTTNILPISTTFGHSRNPYAAVVLTAGFRMGCALTSDAWMCGRCRCRECAPDPGCAQQAWASQSGGRSSNDQLVRYHYRL